jgi:broad specificity phosphatase PhoE
VVEADGSFVRLVDVGNRVEIHRVWGWLPSRLVFLLMNLHVSPRSVWLLRHGESAANAAGRIGGDTPLTERGKAFANALGAFLPGRLGGRPEVWTSTLRRTGETAAALPSDWPRRALGALDEIDAGACEGLTYAEIADRFPDVAAGRAADKLRYRYPGGESYEDVIARLEPVIVDLERQRGDVVVVAHQAVIRALAAYLSGRAAAEAPHLSVPLHTVIRLAPNAYGCDEERTSL